MSQKRQRTFEPGAQWMKRSTDVDKNVLTKQCVEQIFNKAFDLDEFPGWIQPIGGHLMVKGRKTSTEDTVIFSFYPNTGKVLFQGKPEEKINNELKWNKARDALGI